MRLLVLQRGRATSPPAVIPAEAGAACDHVCGPTESCRAGRCQPGCPEGIVYVAESGSDTNRGCAATEPKKTIGSAIAYVKTLGATSHEIRVCRGTYAETGLTLDYPVSLRGGYECALWTRSAAFAWPGWDPMTGRMNAFDQTNTTIIAATGPTALDVRGAAITRAVAIEGFTIRGRDTDGGIGVSIRDGASPTVTLNTISGASGLVPTTDPPTTGLDIADSSAPEIANCKIDGGGGRASAGQAFGSRGVYVHTSGATVIHDNEIDGGRGTSAAAAADAVHFAPPSALTGDGAFTHNHVFFAGNGANGALFGAFGVLVAIGAQVDIVENFVAGDTLGCAGAACTSIGIYAAGAKSRVVRNRVFGGTTSASSATVLVGISAPENVSDIDLFDNVVDLGFSGPNNAVGIEARPGGERRRIVHNTVYGHSVAGTFGVRSYGSDAVVENNLISTVGIGFTTGECAGAFNLRPPTSLRNNAFVVTDVVLSKSTGTCSTGQNANTVSDIDGVLPGVASGNVQLAASCGSQSATVCRTCNDYVQCVQSVFAKPLNVINLLATDAKVRDDAPCMVAQGALDRTALVPVDALNAPRSAPFTIGALEADGTCVP